MVKLLDTLFAIALVTILNKDTSPSIVNRCNADNPGEIYLPGILNIGTVYNAVHRLSKVF